MTGQPDDNYLTDRVGVAGLEALAARALDVTGRAQRIHLHAAGGRCVPGCWEMR